MGEGLGVSCTPETLCHGTGIGAEKHTLYFLLSPLHVLSVYIGEFYNCQVNDALLKEVLEVQQV